MGRAPGKETVAVLNVNAPGVETRVDARKFAAMRAAYLGALPAGPPGVSHAEAKERLLPHLPEALFPGGKTAGWWMKTVQLDAEARGEVARADTRPLTFYRTP